MSWQWLASESGSGHRFGHFPKANSFPVKIFSLDQNATTPIDPEALEAMNRVAVDAWGNPGSRHRAGRRARQALETARETIADILEAAPQEVVFTSGGTESNNLALSGMGRGGRGTILVPGGEHPSIEEPVRQLVAEGWSRLPIPIDQAGRLVQSAVDGMSLDGVLLGTALLVNNETGVIQDLRPLIQRCAEHGIPFHVDAVQAVGKIEVRFHQLQASTLSLAAHKFHGPRGIGALLVRKEIRLQPVLRGGHQESGLRPGTEPVMLAVGMSVALRRWQNERQARQQHVEQLRNHLEEQLLARCAPVFVNGGGADRLSNTSNLSFPGCDGEALLIALDLVGVCCSMGSACASGSLEPSPVLLAMNLPRERYSSAVRFSLGVQNTLEEIDQAIERIVQTVQQLRRSSMNP